MNADEKIELIKSLVPKIVANAIDEEDGECYYIIARLDMETNEIFHKLDSTNADIGRRMRWDKEGRQVVVNLLEFDWWEPELAQILGIQSC